ncbi:MAG: SHOCT domain-containing protein [Nitrospirae bacterium]|nr:MAG: SHOCT domain-containing protein [Nitrospirota bacterium]
MHGGFGIGGAGMGGFGFGWISMVIFTVLVIVAVLFVVKYLTGREEPPIRKEDDPLEILKRRFARGEIDRNEYEETKKLLKRGW